MEPILFTADIHLTTNPKDRYRWDIFPWLQKTVKQRGVGAVVIAGDLTDAKDFHPAALVNPLVEALQALGKVVPVWIITGNHDYVEPEMPFFKFIQGFIPNVTFIWNTTTVEILGRKILMVPHTRRWYSTQHHDWASPDLVVMHQCVKGAVSNGREMDGVPIYKMKTAKRIIAGDIHLPQEIGNIIYVGSPHPVHFGESHEPRVLLHTGGKKLQSVPRLTIRKLKITLTDPANLMKEKFHDGDMVKIVLSLPRSEFHRWKELQTVIRLGCKKRRIVLCGINIKERVKAILKPRRMRSRYKAAEVRRPEDILADFCQHKGLARRQRQAALKFLEPQ